MATENEQITAAIHAVKRQLAFARRFGLNSRQLEELLELLRERKRHLEQTTEPPATNPSVVRLIEASEG